MRIYYIFFFFKQKTAYEMRISDWSSDVCSSDLLTTLYNTAGIIHGAMIQDETLEGWSKMIAVNQTALFLGLKMVAPEIAKSGNGAILNISSLVSVICEPGLISYAATKSAVRAMTKVTALEYVEIGRAHV